MRSTKAAYFAITLSLVMLFVAALGNQFPANYMNIVTPAAADDGVGNNSLPTAKDIPVDTLGYRWYSGLDIMPGGAGGVVPMYLNQTDDDFFNVTVPKDHYYWAEIEFNESIVDLDLFIYDTNGVEIDNSTGAGETEWVGALADSTAEYTVKVTAYNDSYNSTKGEGFYNITLAIDDIYDFPDVRGGARTTPDYTTASELVEGDYHNLILAEDENDIYKILLYPGNSLIVNLTYYDTNADLDLEFYNSSVVDDPSVQPLLFSKATSPANESVIIAPKDLTGPGYYYIRAMGAISSQNSPYSLIISDHEDNYEAGLGFLTQWGASGPENGNFSYPAAVAVNSTGFVYVADAFNNRIQVFYANGKFAFQWGAFGTENGNFSKPMGIAIRQSSGQVFVTDTYNHRFQIFSANGNWQETQGSYGSGDGQFNYPVGLAVTQSGLVDVYIADLSNHRIQKFTQQTNYVYDDQWGSLGTGDGSFTYPSDVAIDSADATIYVTDTFNHRIQTFDNAGDFIAKWGVQGSEPGEFFYPRGIAADSADDIYVVDTWNHRIQVFDNNGQFKSQWGYRGSDAGEFLYPYGVAVNSNGDIYVADSQNNRIQKFAFVTSNNVWKQAFSITGGYVYTGFTQTYAGLLASANRPDWYKFNLLEAQSIRITLDFFHVLSDFDLYFYDGSDAANTNSPLTWSNQSASDTESIGRLPIYHNGTYYLWIRAKDSTIPNRFYNLTVEIRGVDDDFEDNDELIIPNVLPTVDATYELFSLINDPDFFGMPLLQDDHLKARIEFNSSYGNLDLYLYSITGELLNDSASAGTSFEEVTWETRWASFFILEIRGINSSFSWVGVEYNLTITIAAYDDIFEQNDAWGSPSSIAEGNWADLIIRDGDDDWYQVYLVAGDQVSIELNIGIGEVPEEYLQSSLISINQEEDEDEEELMDVDLSVFVRTGLVTGDVDQDLNLIARSETSELVEFIEFTAPRTEIYLIWVEFFIGPNGNYSLLIDIEETDDIYEDNDNMEEASPLTVEGEALYEDLLIRTLDDDWYKVNVQKGYGIYANISFNNVQGDLNLYLISENDTILAYSSSNDSDLEQFAPYEAQATAWYYFVVKQSSETHNTYSLSIDVGPYEELVARHPDIPPAPTGQYDLPGEEGDDTLFGLPPVVVISAGVGGLALGGGGFILAKKGKLKFPFRRGGGGS